MLDSCVSLVLVDRRVEPSARLSGEQAWWECWRELWTGLQAFVTVSNLKPPFPTGKQFHLSENIPM